MTDGGNVWDMHKKRTCCLIDTSARCLPWHVHKANRYFYQVLQPRMALGKALHNSDDSVDLNRVAPM